MIKIHDKLWYVVKPEHEDNLAYMCQAEFAKEGEPSASLKKMQGTGRSWARVNAQTVYKTEEGGTSWDYLRDENNRPVVDYVVPAKEGIESFTDNVPTTGFYIGDSVSRWNTDNKLFRVKDPRNFTVEVPTGNIATLLHHTTVVNGVVQQDCVWGREGNSHILLPVNSEPYLLTLDQMDTLENKLISIKDLKVGDWLKMFDDDKEYYYAGKMRSTWSLRGEIRKYYSYTNQSVEYTEPLEVRDDKWEHVFLYKYASGADKWYVSTPNKPKIVQVVRNERMEVVPTSLSHWCQERVKNKSGMNDGRFYYVRTELVSIEFKE